MILPRFLVQPRLPLWSWSLFLPSWKRGGHLPRDICILLLGRSGGQKVHPKSAVSQLPLAQDNLFAKVAYFWVAYSDPLETKQDPVGLLATKAFLCSPFLDYRKWASFSLHKLPWVATGTFKLLSRGGRGDAETREEQSGNNSAALGQSPGSPSRDTRNNIIELFCRYWNPHQVREVNCMLPTSTETPDRLEGKGWWCWLPLTSPPTNQKNVHELTMPSLNHYYKTPHYTLQVGTHSFEGISPLWPPLPGKAIKLFFSTSPKTLSLRNNSVSGYRGQIQHHPSSYNLPAALGINGHLWPKQLPEHSCLSFLICKCKYRSPPPIPHHLPGSCCARHQERWCQKPLCGLKMWHSTQTQWNVGSEWTPGRGHWWASESSVQMETAHST